ncbi:hypothetical protein CBP51_08675 [Cellvibrio mixtus]|uniref:Uncharacterized protein n=1 Tax=Cellvibrio mixtus TaxID=39650 RepID=A0A266QAY3_9GAMM|nr:hypothetical protein B0D95_12075 [Cellvibrio sp. PSBB023]OZY87044.1 hypothetical protein CBP51_08675 [Cellvibrio mixtus]
MGSTRDWIWARKHPIECHLQHLGAPSNGKAKAFPFCFMGDNRIAVVTLRQGRKKPHASAKLAALVQLTA